VMDGIQATSTSGKRKLSHPEETVVKDVHDITVDVESRDTANPPFSVSIVGGGIAGLGAALALQKKGFLVTVFERDLLFEDRRRGYGLTLTNNPQGPLADLDLLDECISRDCPSNAHWIFAPEGNVLGYYGRSFKSDAETPSSVGIPAIAPRDSQFEGRGNLRIPRQNLRKMMLDRLRPGTVKWGMKLLDYEESVDGVKCYYQSTKNAQLSVTDGSRGTGDSSMPNCEEKCDSKNTARLVDSIEEVHADILVGADGIRSVVRQLRSQKTGAFGNKQLIKESSPLSFVGVAVILGISTVTHPLINRQVGLTSLLESTVNSFLFR
jgi:2-polyprenyl-6-methoxyphenol hydroxylase-like FAD-dependent oxidoreductase